MNCPICKRDTFIELESSRPTWGGSYGWSIKECQNCGYKVQDRTSDERFAGIHHVITKPDMTKVEA